MNPAERIHGASVGVTWALYLLVLAIFFFVRRSKRGGTATLKADDPFLAADLLIVSLIFVLFNLLALQQPSEPSVIRIRDLLVGMFSMVLVTTMATVSLAFRSNASITKFWGLKEFRWHQLLLLTGLISIVIILIVHSVGKFSESYLETFVENAPQQSLPIAFKDRPEFLFRSLVLLTVLVVAPICEEILYRGYLYSVVKKYTHVSFAAIFSSLVFALSHQGLVSHLPLFVLALFLVLSYEVSKSLWVPICIHAYFNFSTILQLVYQISQMPPVPQEPFPVGPGVLP